MKPTLTELWCGNINPKDEIPVDDPKCRELLRNLEMCYDILWIKLDDDGKQVLDKLRAYHTELSFAKNEDSFIQGFSLAVKMMTEALAE